MRAKIGRGEGAECGAHEGTSSAMWPESGRIESRAEFGGRRENRGEGGKMVEEAILRRRAELATWQLKTDWRVQEKSRVNSAFPSAASQNQALLSLSTSIPL